MAVGRIVAELRAVGLLGALATTGQHPGKEPRRLQGCETGRGFSFQGAAQAARRRA
jgi:hypothetical protein